MFTTILKKIFGSSNDRIIASISPIVKSINALEEKMIALSDQELQSKTVEFKERVEKGESLDAILPEAFAVVREASKRVLGLRHFDVQMVGGVVLHRGMISEMKTGEGKTLVATLPIYLNALSGRGVHLVTVNDYLAKRDSQEMGKIFKFLGLTVGCITNEISDLERQQAYKADITYGTNNEFGFDYLRDNLKMSIEQMVQRPFNYAIVDEVDSILIDESRTPLIISGAVEDNSELYVKIDKIISKFEPDDYEVDDKVRNTTLTEKGHETAERLLKAHNIISTGLYDMENMSVVHHVNQALKAHKNFNKDVDYMVNNGKVMIIDEFTGRVLDGRRYSDGLHQALEAKEGVKIQNENQTLASITFQNYFRMYPKLAGMTGTAITEAGEFEDIYKLAVVSVPTHMKVMRKDEEDLIYRTASEKNEAIVEEIKSVHEKGQPILVGTISIEKSEEISKLLKKHKIKHNVLNARYHEQEAMIISQAGSLGAVTIATNMAGRGTDIKLGGNPDYVEGSKISRQEFEMQISANKQKVIELGGLYVLGTERHESRRIDDQLRGRSGRQGDPGLTKFYLSLEDDLMRIFGSEKISSLLGKLGLKHGEAIVHPWISRSIEKAQQKVEGRNFEFRKTLLKFDDVMNDQRTAIYSQRKEIMTKDSFNEYIGEATQDYLINLIDVTIPKNSMKEEWDIETIQNELFGNLSANIDVASFANKEGVDQEQVIEYISTELEKIYAHKREKYGQDMMTHAERHIMLVTLDQLWKDHLHKLDHLRSGINLRAYAQKDPLNEYKMEAFNAFKSMLFEYEALVIQRLYQVEFKDDMPEPKASPKTIENAPNAEYERVGRNDPCPCGSGLKYKHCHGKL